MPMSKAVALMRAAEKARAADRRGHEREPSASSRGVTVTPARLLGEHAAFRHDGLTREGEPSAEAHSGRESYGSSGGQRPLATRSRYQPCIAASSTAYSPRADFQTTDGSRFRNASRAACTR